MFIPIPPDTTIPYGDPMTDGPNAGKPAEVRMLVDGTTPRIVMTAITPGGDSLLAHMAAVLSNVVTRHPIAPKYWRFFLLLTSVTHPNGGWEKGYRYLEVLPAFNNENGITAFDTKSVECPAWVVESFRDYITVPATAS